MTRLELLEAGGFDDNGAFTEILNDLEWCGFIRSYTMMGYRTNSDIFQLIDHYTLFYYEFIDGSRQGSNYWKTLLGSPNTIHGVVWLLNVLASGMRIRSRKCWASVEY